MQELLDSSSNTMSHEVVNDVDIAHFDNGCIPSRILVIQPGLRVVAKDLAPMDSWGQTIPGGLLVSHPQLPHL